MEVLHALLCLILAATTLPVAAALCDSLKAPVNGMVQCSRKLTVLTCIAACNTGFDFETAVKSVTRVCDDTSGNWDDTRALPVCVSNVCREPLLATVNDTQITASSVWSGVRGLAFGPERARLNTLVNVVNEVAQSGGWRAAVNTLDQYIQVELNSITRITGIVTQGRAVITGDTANEYVTRFRVLYSMDGATWRSYGSQTVTDQFLDGNSDNTRPKSNLFVCPFDAKYVRINPLAWHENIALRFDLFGCQPDGSKPACGAQGATTTTPEGTRTMTMTTTATTVAATTPVVPTIVVQTPSKPPIDVCSSLAPPTNGAINCEKRATQLVCVANCNDGYIFESKELLEKRVCMKDTGVWTTGSRLPACIYNTQATPLPPTHNYTRGCVTLQKECDNTGNGDFQACGGCHFFASCSEGFLYVRACPEMLLFDAALGLCDYHSSSCPSFNKPIG